LVADEEGVTERDHDLLRLRKLGPGAVDLMSTHTPPASALIELGFGNLSVTSGWVEQAWRLVGCPPLVCGHQHQSATVGNVQILDMLETTRR
jgi:hypothetical protein